MTRQDLDNIRVKLVRPWQNLRRIASKPAGPHGWKASQSEICWCGGGDIIQAKGKKLGQGVSMKSLKGAHFKVELQGKL